MEEVNKYLAHNNCIIKSKIVNNYGTYYTAIKKYSKGSIELSISKLLSTKKIHISLRGKHFEGHTSGWVNNIEEITPIINFMTSNR